MIRHSRFLLIALAVGLIAFALQAGDPFKPGKLPPAEVAALQQGLTLRFYAKTGDKDALDARRVRLAALHVSAGAPPTPFVAPGPFHAQLTGYIKNSLKGAYSFRFKGSGTIALKINEKLVLDAADKDAEVELAKNFNRIEIAYSSPSTGDATMRLYWANEKFGFEPVPPDALSSRSDEKDLVEKTTLREGRQLYANRHCAQCHPAAGDAMPEMHRGPGHLPAPRLDNAGDRFQFDWLAAWIMNPRSLRPEATMPSVLAGPDAQKKAADIAAYLLSLKREDLKFLGKANSSNGEATVKQLGCVACHRFDDPKAKDELGRLSLHHLGVKFVPNAIAHFLKEPHRRYNWIRMPDFRLTDEEAGNLEAFLRREANGKIDAQPKGDVKRGSQLFVESCSACHTDASEGGTAAKRSIPLKSLDKGCLAAKDHGKAPDFGLLDTERAALVALLKTDGKSLARDTPAEFAQRQVQQLQCTSCHRRDGAVTRWHAVLEDEGKVPETLPSLTWTGEKLKPAWTTKLLLGQTDHSARPWIKARMPAFPARAKLLAVGLSHEHGFGANEDPTPPPDAKLAAIGAKLIPQQGGFNCINCHGIGAQKAADRALRGRPASTSSMRRPPFCATSTTSAGCSPRIASMSRCACRSSQPTAKRRNCAKSSTATPAVNSRPCGITCRRCRRKESDAESTWSRRAEERRGVAMGEELRDLPRELAETVAGLQLPPTGCRR